MVAAALAGEWLGGTSTVGTAEYGFISGISGSWYCISNAVGTIILAFTLAAFYRRSKAVTATELLEKYQSPSTRVVGAVLLAICMIMVGSVQIVSGGVLMAAVLQMDYRLMMVIMGVVFLAYTLAGGLLAIGYTNMLHIVVCYIGCILALFVANGMMDGGFETLQTSLPPSFFSMTGMGGMKVADWFTTSVLAALVAQAAIQPVMGARDERTARNGALMGALIILPLGFITALLGMYSRVIFPGIGSKEALPTLLMNIDPALGGVVLAGVTAAILSTVAPCILAGGTLITRDLHTRFFSSQLDERETLKFSRIYTLICGIIAIVLALYVPVILDQMYFAYTFRAMIAVILVASVTWKRTHPVASISSLIVAVVVASAWRFFYLEHGAYPFGLGMIFATLLFSIPVLLIVSMVLKRKVSAGQ